MSEKSADGLRPGPRHGFAWAFRYQPKGEKNDLYIHGGVDCDGNLMDSDGKVWMTKLHRENDWKAYTPFNGSQIPPHRYGLSGGICKTRYPVFNTPGDTDVVNNFVTFGGFDSFADDYTNDTWVFCEFKLKGPNRKIPKFWKWVKADNVPSSSFTPAPRSDAVMVFYTGEDDDNCFFLLGGKDDSGRIQDAAVGTFQRTTPTPDTVNTPTPTGTWGGTYETEIVCRMEWDKKADPPDEVGLEGAAAVYDPYYGDNPRILVYGGINADEELSAKIYQYDLINDAWATFTPKPTATPAPTTAPGTPTNTPVPTYPTPVPRAYHAMSLDIREHRLLVHGGNPDVSDPQDSTAFDDLWEFDILTQAWRPLETTDTTARWKHAGVFYWFTLFGGRDDSGVCHDDLLEYKPEESGKVWDVIAGSDYGLNHPESVINTQRVKSNDTVRIHQTQSTWPGDVFTVKDELYIPYYIRNLTLEGVNNGEIRAGLWAEYAPTPTGPPVSRLDNPMLLDLHSEEGLLAVREEGFSMSPSTVIQDSAGSTFRNLIIGHYPPGGTPQYDLDADMLAYYQTISNTTGKIVDMQMLDVGLIAVAPARVDNCEFLANGTGYVMICVSSIWEPNWVHDSIFRNNMIGALELETRHQVYNNIFIGNKLCGIEFDKGAHGMAYDNLFIGNGDSLAKEEWRCGIISGYSIVAGVPAVQQPLIYNNTFVDNPAALSIWEDGDIRQFVNSPCFFNNILYSTAPSSDPAVIRVNNARNRLVSFHNCMYGYENFFETHNMKLLSSRDFIDDPLFADTDKYRLSIYPTSSPCIDEGFHTLSPGVTDMNGIMDGYYMDIGYHFTDIIPVMGPPEDPADDGEELTWSAPSGSSPAGYVVYWEDVDGVLIDLEFIEPTPRTFEVPETERDRGYWFGVCGHDNIGQFGETAFIEL